MNDRQECFSAGVCQVKIASDGNCEITKTDFTEGASVNPQYTSNCKYSDNFLKNQYFRGFS